MFGLTLSIATIIGTIITGIIGIIIAPIGKAFLQKAKNGPAAVSAAGLFIDGKLRFCVADDFGEGLRVETGAADESAVDVAYAAEGLCVVGLNGAAVEDAGGGGEGGREGFGDLGADDFVGVFGDLRRGGAAGADGPYGLVGKDDRRGDGGVDAFESDGGLEFEDVAGEIGFSLFEFFADADDGGERVG